MTFRDEFNEILEDLQHTDLDDDTNREVRERLRDAVLATVTAGDSDTAMDRLAQLTLLSFYAGREHHARGYTLPTGASGYTPTVPDTVEQLLRSDLYRWHVEFHCDVLASDPEAAIAAAEGDDWRVTRLD